MWTKITRPKYERDLLRYASDLTDGEWKVLEPLLPRAKALGRPRTTALREVVNAILYLLRSGCPWRMLPRDFPPRSGGPASSTQTLVPGSSLNRAATTEPAAPAPTTT